MDHITLSNTDYVNLVDAWKAQGCIAARNRVIMNTVNLVRSIANRYATHNSRDDLFSEGVIGVMHACNTFLSEKGVHFLVYASTCIRNNILNYVRTDHVVPRGSQSMHSSNLSFFPVPETHSEVLKLAVLADVSYDTAQKYALISRRSSLEAADEVLTSDSTYQAAVMLERCEQLIESLQGVKNRDYHILSRYLVEEDTYKTIGADYGISIQRVEQIVKQVRQQLGEL